MKLPRYTRDLFTDRDTAIGEVQKLAEKMRRGEQLASRTIVFRGARGYGKSWLAVHLKREVLSRQEGVLPLFLGFGEGYERIFEELKREEQEWYRPPSLTTPAGQVANLVSWMASEFDVPRTDDLSTSAVAGYLLRTLQAPPVNHKGRRYRVLALVIDAIFDAPDALLDELEQKLLGGLSGFEHVLIVLTGREKSYLWQSPSLAIPHNAPELPSFSEQPDDLARQLRLQLPELQLDKAEIERIIAIGQGYPLNNYLVARALHDPSAWDEAVAELVGSGEMLAELNALCVLDGFREDDIVPMVRQYRHAQQHKTLLGPMENSEEDLREARAVADELVRRRLARWDWQEGQYILAPSIRPVLAHVLKIKQPAVAELLHRRAQQLYAGLATQLESDYYREQAKTHQQRADALQLEMRGGAA